jgi:hypothetical protein
MNSLTGNAWYSSPVSPHVRPRQVVSNDSQWLRAAQSEGGNDSFLLIGSEQCPHAELSQAVVATQESVERAGSRPVPVMTPLQLPFFILDQIFRSVLYWVTVLIRFTGREGDGARSIVMSARRDLNPLIIALACDPIDKPMLTRDPSRPKAGKVRLERLRLSYAHKRRSPSRLQ